MSAQSPAISGSGVLWRVLDGVQARVRVRGPDAKRFLHGMVSNDVLGLKPGQGCRAALLTVKGKLLGDLAVYDCGDAGLLLEMVAGVRDKVCSDLDRHLIMDDATVQDASAELAELGVYGTGAQAALGLAETPPLQHFARLGGDAETSALAAATGELGLPGFHVIAPPAQLSALLERLSAAGAEPLSAEQAEVLRIEAGTPLYGIDIDEERLPQEAGLDDAVSFTKGCYLGQEVVARLSHRGHLNRKLHGLRFRGGLPPAGAKLSHPSRANAGNVTSTAHSPRLGDIGLGYVHRSVWEPGTELTVVNDAGEPLGQTALVTTVPFA